MLQMLLAQVSGFCVSCYKLKVAMLTVLLHLSKVSFASGTDFQKTGVRVPTSVEHILCELAGTEFGPMVWIRVNVTFQWLFFLLIDITFINE